MTGSAPRSVHEAPYMIFKPYLVSRTSLLHSSTYSETVALPFFGDATIAVAILWRCNRRDHSGRGLPDVRLDGYAFCHLRHVF
jgi:hypothetical protein